ncbi:hypothetical protein PG994_005090 [Apiospora phragmitis]|uniref:Uncharacterized protein n=1 Tax=Apiospora phragmitis TaxID=2905665 RepID=A0ABR1VSE7_9PEZI
MDSSAPQGGRPSRLKFHLDGFPGPSRSLKELAIANAMRALPSLRPSTSTTNNVAQNNRLPPAKIDLTQGFRRIGSVGQVGQQPPQGGHACFNRIMATRSVVFKKKLDKVSHTQGELKSFSQNEIKVASIFTYAEICK